MAYDDKKWHILYGFDDALENEYIKVYYQPVIRTLSEQLCGWEALTRWQEPGNEMLSPAEFIPILEQGKLIHRLDLYVIDRVCADVRKLMDDGGDVEPVSINLSRLDFELCDIFSEVEALVKKHRIPRDLLDIEITESILMEHQEILAGEIHRFQNKGYQVWMDDFGSGYSSFNVLKDYSFDVLKIDMIFLRDFDKNPKSRSIVASIVNMAKHLGIQTLAEGVETEEQLAFLKGIGCGKVQGYYFNRPAPYDEAMGVLKAKGIKAEDMREREYHDSVSGVNVLSVQPLLSYEAYNDSLSDNLESGIPIAIVESRGGRVRYLMASRAHIKTLQSLGIKSVKDAEEYYNSDGWSQKSRIAEMAEDTRRDGEEKNADFIEKGMVCHMRLQHIATAPKTGVSSFIAILRNHSSFFATDDDLELQTMLRYMYCVYDRVDILSKDGEYTDNIYKNSTRYKGKFVFDSVESDVHTFARENVYPEDRDRFAEYYDMSTMDERFIKSGNRYLIDFFRVRTLKGEYKWQNFMLTPIELNGRDMVLSCVFDSSPDVVKLAGGKYEPVTDAELAAEAEKAGVPLAAVLENMMDFSDYGLFWKDKNRRFLGANTKFLEYYDFSSLDAILGKTDEEMGWHINPDQYIEDELRVIEKGETIKDSPGQCIVRGLVRDIEASKRPLYYNGKIVGLVGIFKDVTEKRRGFEAAHNNPYVDMEMGVHSGEGLYSAISFFEDAYWEKGVDFAIIYMELLDFEDYRNTYGSEFTIKLLHRVASVLRKNYGENSVIIHKSETEFLVLHQYVERGRVYEQERHIMDILSSIHTVDHIPMDVKATVGVSIYSETENAKRMMQVVDSRKNDVKI